MGWHGVANSTPGQWGAILLPSLRIFLHFFYSCFIIVGKEKSPKILVEINLGLVQTRKFNLFLHTLYAFYCDNIKYEISSQILYHMILLVKSATLKDRPGYGLECR